MALQSFSHEQNRLQEDVLRGKSPEQIVQLTTKLLESGRGGSGTSSKPAIQRKTQPSKQLDVQPKTVTGNPGLQDFVTALVKEVAAACDTVLAVDEVSAVAGELLIMDRTTHSDYISVYKAQGGEQRPKAICSFRLRRRIGGFRVQLPLPKDSPLLEGIVESDIVLWKDGAFQTVVNDVIPGGVRMDHIKVIMANLVQGA
jgi:hypothetical protein